MASERLPADPRERTLARTASRLCDYLVREDGRWTTAGVGRWMDPVLAAIQATRRSAGPGRKGDQVSTTTVCDKCGRPTPHKHLHDAAHGIAEEALFQQTHGVHHSWVALGRDMKARAEAAESQRDAALAEVERLRKSSDDYKALMFEADERAERRLKQLVSAESQRDRAVQAAGRLIDCIEVLAERAAEVGWIDKDQKVEGEILAARELLKEVGTP